MVDHGFERPRDSLWRGGPLRRLANRRRGRDGSQREDHDGTQRHPPLQGARPGLHACLEGVVLACKVWDTERAPMPKPPPPFIPRWHQARATSLGAWPLPPGQPLGSSPNGQLMQGAASRFDARAAPYQSIRVRRYASALAEFVDFATGRSGAFGGAPTGKPARIKPAAGLISTRWFPKARARVWLGRVFPKDGDVRSTTVRCLKPMED